MPTSWAYCKLTIWGDLQQARCRRPALQAKVVLHEHGVHLMGYMSRLSSLHRPGARNTADIQAGNVAHAKHKRLVERRVVLLECAGVLSECVLACSYCTLKSYHSPLGLSVGTEAPDMMPILAAFLCLSPTACSCVRFHHTLGAGHVWDAAAGQQACQEQGRSHS